MKILMINQDWFAAEWRAAGHEVLIAGSGDQCDVRPPVPLLRWEAICALHPGGFSPDCIIVHDNSSPITISGLEEAKIPTAFYSVDVHHHLALHRYIAGSFDHTFVAQRDYIPGFHEVGENPQWLPLWASRVVEASSEKRMEAVFVGTMDANLNPDRVRFFTELQKQAPLVIERGEYWNIFPFAEIVVNQTVKGDVNFRVFEAMMCGATLLTEMSPNGLTELFTPDQQLVTYEKGNVADAAAKITALLADRGRCRAIASAGRAEIMRAHLPQHRAATVLEVLQNLTKRESRRRHFGMLANFSTVSTTFDTIDTAIGTRCIWLALRAAQEGSRRNELMTADLACHVVMSALRHDQRIDGRMGALTVEELFVKYPGEPVLRLAIIRDLLNHGRREDASKLAEFFTGSEPAAVFELSEKVVSELLARATR